MNTHAINDIKELALFQIDDAVYGIDINYIQEINKNLSFSRAYNSSGYIKGILNLRGQIVTVIDLRVKFGRSTKAMNSGNRVIIVKYKGESVGLLVDNIEDIIEVDHRELERSSVKIEGVDSKYFAGVYKLAKNLVIILDIEAILYDEGATAAVA
jgi:purine-binding chemotaxis protein CheW